jgi:hypothetical protein
MTRPPKCGPPRLDNFVKVSSFQEARDLERAMLTTKQVPRLLRLSNAMSVLVFLACLATISLYVTACGWKVVVSPSSQTALLGNTIQFKASHTVDWSVNGVPGGTPELGTITDSGLYTAPSDLPNNPTVTITATSRSDRTKSGSASVQITSDISVAMSTIPSNQQQLFLGGILQLTADITSNGHPDKSVKWSVNGILNGNSVVGTITSVVGTDSVTYTAPQSYPSKNPVQITAQSQADHSKTGMLPITLSILVSVSPNSANLLLGNTQQFTATVSGSNQAVAWSISGGSSALGTISNAGLYTAPADLPNPATVMITATSQADSSKSGNVFVNLASGITISIATTPSNDHPFPYGATVLLTATISSQGRPDPAVSWFVNGVANGSQTVGTISPTSADTATYTAPQSYANPKPVQIAAQSVADPSKQGQTQLDVFNDAVLAGAGDIADCINLTNAMLTEDLLDGIPGTVFADGDLAYPNGSDSDFSNCYDPSWGSLKSRTRPVPGNHEYMTPNAQGYFDYWGTLLTGTAAEPTKGYYSYDLGAWHVVVINSACELLPPGTGLDGCDAGSPQQQWLNDDLAAHSGVCTIALWHVPYFVPIQASPTDEPRLKAIWQTLLDADIHVVVNGHLHDYQRWARQDPNGNASGAGIRQFVIGTGGSNNPDEHCLGGTPGCPNPPNTLPYSGPNLEVIGNGLNYGVLMLTLHRESYDWQHIVVGGSAGDSGTESCHSIPAAVHATAAHVTLAFAKPTNNASRHHRHNTWSGHSLGGQK